MNSSPPRRAGSSAAGLAFLTADGDRFVVEADRTASVGESDAKDVAGEVHRARPTVVATEAVSWRIQRLLHTASGMTRSGHFRRRRSRNLARTNLSRALMGTRKFRRAGCQVVASSDIPPLLTRQ